MPEMKEPRLSEEIGRVAWFMTKLLVPAVVLMGAFYFLLRNYPILGLWILWGLMIFGQIVFYGWQNYKWKKNDWEREQREKRERTGNIADNPNQSGREQR